MHQKDKKSLLSIPCHWSESIIETIVSNSSGGDVEVSEVYGAVADGGPIGHGRANSSVINPVREDALRFRQFLRQNGLGFTYLLNAPFEFDGSKEQKDELSEYLNWVLYALAPDSLTISSLELMRYVRAENRDIPINVSTIASVRNVADLRKFMEINPRRVVPQHDVGKELGPLLELVEFCQREEIELELMATESCLFRCPDMRSHYKSLAQGRGDKKFHLKCNARKLSSPKEFLMAGGMIRPEDISVYEDLGIRYFKITGRSKPSSWLPEVVSAYLSRTYSGNLIRLLGIDPLLQAEEWIYIENSALDGLLRELLNCASYAEKTACAEDWISRLSDMGQFKLLDGSTYKRKENLLHLSVAGERAKSLF